jgi:hypothetical protein
MIITFLAIFWLHFIADFILQTDEMALNKSHSFKWLTLHTLTYGIPFLLFGWKYTMINSALHWVVDCATSRMTAHLWKLGERHWFFVVIGLDQAIHMTFLVLTLRLR